MRRIRLFLFSTALLVALFGMTAFAGVDTAAASTILRSHPLVTCSANGCNGKDPVVTGCSADAYTVQTAVLSTAFVQLRYSRTCKTNWGRVISRIDLAHLYVRVDRIDGLSYFGSISTGTLVFSPMVYAPVLRARACGTVKGVSGCTASV